jgi:hypothetical protein
VVLLVILLGRPEGPRRNDLGHDRTGQLLRRLERRLRRERQLLLRFVVEEDRRAILAAVVAELRVARDRVDVVPEDVEQLLVADLGGIVDDVYRLGVARDASRDLLVGGWSTVPPV